MPPLQTNRNRHFSERFVGAAYMRPAELPPPQTSRAACMPPLRASRKRHFLERVVGAAYMRPAEFPPPQTSRAACMPPLRTNPPTSAHPAERSRPLPTKHP